ncbi:hypothetical protein GZ77_00925 [Endozoicomonas montiporae]|uniref:DUF1853 family protein n=2 Tax=Endozoicomonas montiporae TaxID=1027273 RepID=A0A081N9Z4_9GAMM|nr:DUF1853 family protein [Endozoicomonas montiporae]AMO57065.1 hypothetical protein EZMO1_3030 [Endozoicomonas montiporae CL-33]KEQ15267.1 hypothetical protein GZ77_00925 [Endozoicomonas montiporae]
MSQLTDLTGLQLSRDLQWIQNSPVLFNGQSHDCFVSSVLPECQSDLFQPGYSLPTEAARHITTALGQKRWHLLGIYYETLWHYLLDQHPAIQTLASNLQVQKADRSTLGEFDLIYHCLNTGITTHLELAVKFYLGIPDASQKSDDSSWHQWVGPGLKDRMDRKLHRLLNHQIRLGQTAEGAAVLKSLGVNQLVQAICFQGYLFYPVHGHCPAPADCNPNHLRGSWISLSALPEWLAKFPTNLLYFRPAKLKWLAPFLETHFLETPGQENKRQLADNPVTLCQSLKPLNEPQLVIACSEQANGYQEHHRFFVVPDNWQQKAEFACEKTE